MGVLQEVEINDSLMVQGGGYTVNVLKFSA